MRGREFIMKDLYSFDLDEAGLEESYQAMYRAYTNVFKRCGLKFRPVEADSGAIGGNASQEFMVLAEAGEALILYCPECNYAANVEKAVSQITVGATGPAQNLELVATPDQKTIEQVSDFLKVSPEQTVKTLFYGTDSGYVAVLLRGSDQVNEIKLGNLVGGNKLYLAPPEEINELFGLPVGFMGPVGLDPSKIRVIADLLVEQMHDVVIGANQAGYHYCHAEPARDFGKVEFKDIRLANAGETCSRCGKGSLESARGIEVGQIFKLGTKYSKALEANFLDEKGQSQPIIMGCYGIGVSRTMSAAIEQNYDENGIKWPMAIAPYQIHLIPVSADQIPVAEEIYNGLRKQKIEVLLDDRNERPGVKFKDADLIGIPLRITIGPKGLAQGEAEVRFRQTGEDARWPISEVVAKAVEFVEQSLK
jgi:prolyl-tRNA synthetase